MSPNDITQMTPEALADVLKYLVTAVAAHEKALLEASSNFKILRESLERVYSMLDGINTNTEVMADHVAGLQKVILAALQHASSRAGLGPGAN